MNGIQTVVSGFRIKLEGDEGTVTENNRFITQTHLAIGVGQSSNLYAILVQQ